MDNSRRGFLKTAGISMVGLGCGAAPLVQALAANAIQTEAYTKALVGKRWGMIIDTKKCAENTDCNACWKACHLNHNVPQIDNPRHEIKWLWKEKYGHAFPNQIHEYTASHLKQRDVLVLCNHCDNPPCVRVCPTQATWKRDDGLVMMDQHRCIGCRFCIVACPYGSRSFNWKKPDTYIRQLNNKYPHRTKGVVEKCNFCSERLAKGLLPICVEACQRTGSNAIYFGDVSDPNSEISLLLKSTYTVRRKQNLGTKPHVFYVV